VVWSTGQGAPSRHDTDRRPAAVFATFLWRDAVQLCRPHSRERRRSSGLLDKALGVLGRGLHRRRWDRKFLGLRWLAVAVGYLWDSAPGRGARHSYPRGRPSQRTWNLRPWLLGLSRSPTRTLSGRQSSGSEYVSVLVSKQGIVRNSRGKPSVRIPKDLDNLIQFDHALLDDRFLALRPCGYWLVDRRQRR
jgi:hypothetical protein